MKKMTCLIKLCLIAVLVLSSVGVASACTSSVNKEGAEACT